jgi:parallel beta-helix repeat protein
MTQRFAVLAIGVAACCVACAEGESSNGADDPGKCTVTVPPSDDAQDKLQGAFIDAASGDTICLEKGTYKLSGQLSLATDHVTVRGVDGTLLDFSDQESGANGIELIADHDTLDTLHIQNTKGDGVRATQVDYPTIRNVRVEWTNGPSTDNGGYGIYPVTSGHVLVEHCFASGASDTGIYVGQSHDIIVRDNEATANVTGIEIENSTDAEVYDNDLHGNSAGILVFNLPGLEVKDGKRANVHDNTITDNNLENFAEEGNIVHDVPTGTGMFIEASDENEIHGNTIKDNHSMGISIVSWHLAQRDDEGHMDADYDWYPERNNVHDNMLSGNGDDPMGSASLIAALVKIDAIPNLVWDGFIDQKKLDGETVDSGVPPMSLRNCFKDNGDASFINLDVPGSGAGKSTDVTPYECTRDPLEPIKF